MISVGKLGAKIEKISSSRGMTSIEWLDEMVDAELKKLSGEITLKELSVLHDRAMLSFVLGVSKATISKWRAGDVVTCMAKTKVAVKQVFGLHVV